MKIKDIESNKRVVIQHTDCSSRSKEWLVRHGFGECLVVPAEAGLSWDYEFSSPDDEKNASDACRAQ